MALENVTYVPTLAVRPSEMNGLEFLPGAAKDRITPCFLLAPWANSASLERTIIRIERAYPNRFYLLDIDHDYMPTNIESGPQQELELLKDSQGCFANWVEFVGSHDFVLPCLQTREQSETELLKQIEAFQKLGKAYCVRILRDSLPENLPAIVRALNSSGAADFAIILEGGWTNDALSLASWAGGVISASLSSIDASVPIVVSCTSMPRMFTDFSGDTPSRVVFSNRQLVQQVARASNRQRVMYGDWASTSPRRVSGFAQRPLARIDDPTDSHWLIARNKERQWSFRDAALAIEASRDWNGSLGIWGEEMIHNTTINEALGIDTAQKNVACRVNIHLYRQALYGLPPLDPSALDENWQD